MAYCDIDITTSRSLPAESIGFIHSPASNDEVQTLRRGVNLEGLKMSECCFHVQIQINYLLNISVGVAAASCFDLIVHSAEAQEEVTQC